AWRATAGATLRPQERGSLFWLRGARLRHRLARRCRRGAARPIRKHPRERGQDPRDRRLRARAPAGRAAGLARRQPGRHARLRGQTATGAHQMTLWLRVRRVHACVAVVCALAASLLLTGDLALPIPSLRVGSTLALPFAFLLPL